MTPFNNIYQNRTVLVTGHTGFKGSWLALWLQRLGANVIGYALPEPPTTPSNFILSNLSQHITDIRGDIRDYDQLHEVIVTHQPTIVFHLSAQPIVLRSVTEPHLTMHTNALGTVNMLEAIRQTNSVRALVSITTDKVYHDAEWLWGYREIDRLGGHDPYSASKAMAELAIASYRETYFPTAKYGEHGVGIASVRAGNVIGGGDFAPYRLVPDCMKALINGEPIGIRNPLSVRPWQLVLEPLSGYLWLGAKLLQGDVSFAEAWNFGPLEVKGIPAQALAEKLIELWGSGQWLHTDPNYAKVETGYLRLSWEKAAVRLGWRPVYTWEEALADIVAWHKSFVAQEDMYAVGWQHIHNYTQQAHALGLPWVS
ncbi:MAG: CDP-glucose 4,6-dehydratase [Ardenticatenaceae bacterium]|nr:CDP-glucose 4,6-dehydratase [Ardenticatenaceae bacterium]